MGTEQAVWECTFEVGVKLVHYAESNTWRVTVFDRAAAGGPDGRVGIPAGAGAGAVARRRGKEGCLGLKGK